MRILVVEDDRDIAELVRYNLIADAHDVTIVYDGIPALCELRKDRFDLLILDLMLPALPGLEVCKAVRANPVLKDLPILIMTAHVDAAIRDTALSMGANDYLPKPFTPCDLRNRMRKLAPVSTFISVASTAVSN